MKNRKHKLLEMYMGLFPYEECRIKSLSFFIPIEVKYITKLDKVFENINYKTKGVKFRMAYKSIANDYTRLELNRLSWKKVFSINYSQINNKIDYFSLRLFRLTESLLFLQIDFDLSDIVGYHFWNVISCKYEGKEIDKKHYKEIHHNDSIQKMAIDSFLTSLEKECKTIIDSYFHKFYFFNENYHYPCIRTYFFHKITENTKYIDSFWKNMGINDIYPNYYLTSDSNFLLKHDYEENTVSIFVNYRNIKLHNMYQNIENQVHFELEEILASFGPSISISEIYNYLYLQYRMITKGKNYYTNPENALKLSNLLKYIYEFSREILSDDIFIFHKLDFYPNIVKNHKTYIENIKNILNQKKEILDSIYEKENRVLTNTISYAQALFNTKMQKMMFWITIVAIIAGAVVTIIASS